MAPRDPSPSRTAAISLGVAAVTAIAGFAAVYVTLGRPDNVPPPAKTSSGANPLSQGHMAGFVFRKRPEPLPDAKFQDGSGKERTFADWRGKVVLLNLWATWCLPCRKEMPALDRLQKELGSDKFEVVAISVDRKGMDGARKFLAETKAEHLSLYVDPTTRLISELSAPGLPATLLIDGHGREIGRLLGPAEWDSEDAMRLIRSFLN